MKCLVVLRKRFRPVGYGLIRVGVVSIAGDPNHIEACRIIPSLWDGINQSAIPGISCQATIILSLRDVH